MKTVKHTISICNLGRVSYKTGDQ